MLMAAPDHKYTRREYMLMVRVNRGLQWEVACRDVHVSALAHPDWDLDERRTFMEWEGNRG